VIPGLELVLVHGKLVPGHELAPETLEAIEAPHGIDEESTRS